MSTETAPASPPPRPLVGRVRELAEIVDVLRLDATTPGSGVVLLSGDAGAGKSRLLTEVCTRASDLGYRVVVGHCLDFGESALPYLPFSELFGRIAADYPELAEKLADVHPAVRRLMPSSRLGDSHMRDQAVDRSELFEVVHAVLDELGAVQPLLVIVEDVHWADQSTREMLSFLFARGFAAPVSLAVSYRSDDLHRRHPLRASVAEWMRLPRVHRLQLGRLSDKDVRALIRGLGEAKLAESEIGSIVKRAEGNAFFAEELVGAARYGRASLPGDLADLLLVRVDQLDPAARQAVRASAVAGRRVSHAALSCVVDLDAAELEMALRTAVEHNVLVLVGDDGYAFRHALLAEAVYDDLLPGERLRLHRAYVEAAMSSDENIVMPAAEIARHARAAHDKTVAITASIEAGDEAMSVGGPDDAGHHYEHALELVTGSEASGEPVPDLDLTGLVTKAAEAMTAAGHPYRAADLLRDQLAHRVEVISDIDQARLLLALAATSLITDSPDDPLEATTRALELVPAEPPSALRAQLLSMHARAHAAHGHDREAAQWANEALGISNALRLHLVVAEAAITLGIIDKRAGDPEASRRALTQIASEAREKGDVVGELRALHNLGFIHLDQARLAEAQQVYEEAARRAASAGRPWGPYGIDARYLAAVTAYIRGEWAQVDALVDLSGQSPSPVAEGLLSGVALQVAAGRGDEQFELDLGRSRASWHLDGVIALTAGAAAIDLLGDRGDLDGSLAIHDEVVDLITGLWQQPLFQARVRLSALMIGQLATAAARSSVEDRSDLVKHTESLLAVADETYRFHTRKGRMTGPEAAAWMARAVAEAGRVRWLAAVDPPPAAELVESWRVTADAFATMGHVFETARSEVRLAAALAAIGDAAEAKSLLGRARDVAQQLGAGPLIREIRLSGGAGRRSPDADRHGETLTPRELQIVALVAEGRSNGEIAQQLYISVKTVSVHVSNILAKLGASGRGEAAAIARRRGLIA